MNPLPRYTETLEASTNLLAHLRAALMSLNEAKQLFPRKHRLNPDDPEHPATFAAEGTFPILVMAGEALVAAMEINQRAIPIPEGHECLPFASAPLRQAAAEAMARATRRRLDNELDCLIRMGTEPPKTPPHTEGGEATPETKPTGNSPSGDCPPPSTKSAQ